MKNISIRKKIFGAMFLISLIPIILMAIFSIYITQRSMRQQLIRNREIGMEWMNDKLTVELNNYSEVFYDVEVDKEIKNHLISVAMGSEWEESILRSIRENFEEVLNMYPEIISIEIYDYNTENGYVATRDKFVSQRWEKLREIWETRDADLQTNCVIRKDGEDFLILHQVREFSTNRIIAAIVVRLNQYAFADQIEKDMMPGETAVLYNDEGKILKKIGDGTGEIDERIMEDLRIGEQKGDTPENIYGQSCFYFHESISNGKMALTYVVPDQLIREQLRATLILSVVIMACAFIAVIILSAILSEVISKPIVSLTKKMQNTDIRSFTVTEEIKRNDEIGLLQRSFDKMMLKNQDLVQREYQSEIEKKSAQLRALQAQINPHFLYNSLQMIAGMAITGKGKEIYSMVTALSDILRYAISFAEETVTLEKELQYLNSYMFIQNCRFDERLEREMDISDGALKTYIPKLILQPLVENCFEHGLRERKGKWRICIKAYLQEETMIIEITDNGLGIAPEKMKEIQRELSGDDRGSLNDSAHIGLKNVNARIRIQSGKEFGVKVESRQGEGTKITVKLKAVKEQN